MFSTMELKIPAATNFLTSNLHKIGIKNILKNTHFNNKEI